eukprot:CAMPEP_0117562836 /NCGR_PEP_ID=MMETSP0784-20121206/55175_1 /TAXON_ID=39447 /ORGANISM="" /LENGTH=56 /DNA_ID=CAMNT_0005360445 /DNA_START=115 /DNA_END=282 /DNA_ORIENTATION=-
MTFMPALFSTVVLTISSHSSLAIVTDSPVVPITTIPCVFSAACHANRLLYASTSRL